MMDGCSRDCEENDWEMLSLPHPPQEYSNGDDGNCCAGGLGIDPQGLIVVNYFACPSPGRDEYYDRGGEFRVSFAVQGSSVGPPEDDGSRARNCSETEEQQGVSETLDAVAKAEGLVMGVDHMGCHMTDGLCIRPPLSYALRGLELSLLDGGTEGALRRLWPEENKDLTEGSEFGSELQIVENEGSKVAEKSDEDAGADDRVEKPLSCCVMDCKCEAWWKRPLGILGSKARQIWSLGMAVTVMGSVILGRRWYLGKHPNHYRTLRFQIYAHDKRISQLMCQAARLNEAFSAARGTSVVRARISFGGYHDGLQILTS